MITFTISTERYKELFGADEQRPFKIEIEGEERYFRMTTATWHKPVLLKRVTITAEEVTL